MHEKINSAISKIESCLPRQRSRKAEAGGEPPAAASIVARASGDTRVWNADRRKTENEYSAASWGDGDARSDGKDQPVRDIGFLSLYVLSLLCIRNLC